MTRDNWRHARSRERMGRQKLDIVISTVVVRAMRTEREGRGSKKFQSNQIEQQRLASQFIKGQKVRVDNIPGIGVIILIDSYSGAIRIRFGRGKPKNYYVKVVHPAE